MESVTVNIIFLLKCVYLLLGFIITELMFSLFQNFCVSLIKGFIDSLRGVTVLLYLDKEINERALSRSPPVDFESSKHKQKQSKVKQYVLHCYKKLR